MNTNFKLAWRNLWRNRRRTLIVVSSVIFSVLLASWMRSMQEGSYESMIDNVVKYYSVSARYSTLTIGERTLENSAEFQAELIIRSKISGYYPCFKPSGVLCPCSKSSTQ